MAKPVYRGFTPLNNRRCDLINKEFTDGKLSPDEKRELIMLTTCVEAMMHYRCPMKFKRIPKAVRQAMKELDLKS